MLYSDTVLKSRGCLVRHCSCQWPRLSAVLSNTLTWLPPTLRSLLFTIQLFLVAQHCCPNAWCHDCFFCSLSRDLSVRQSDMSLSWHPGLGGLARRSQRGEREGVPPLGAAPFLLFSLYCDRPAFRILPRSSLTARVIFLFFLLAGSLRPPPFWNRGRIREST